MPRGRIMHAGNIASACSCSDPAGHCRAASGGSQNCIKASGRDFNDVIAGVCMCVYMQAAAVRKQLGAKCAEADSLSRRVGAVNSLSTAYEQVCLQLRSMCSLSLGFCVHFYPCSA